MLLQSWLCARGIETCTSYLKTAVWRAVFARNFSVRKTAQNRSLFCMWMLSVYISNIRVWLSPSMHCTAYIAMPAYVLYCVSVISFYQNNKCPRMSRKRKRTLGSSWNLEAATVSLSSRYIFRTGDNVCLMHGVTGIKHYGSSYRCHNMWRHLHC